MDGTETGWSRPAEPAPRWRALLDRARLGGRAGEQAEPPRAGDDFFSDWHSAGDGFQGRAPIGRPEDREHPVDPRELYGPSVDRRPTDGLEGYGAGRQFPEQRRPERPGPDRYADQRSPDSGYPTEYRYPESDGGYRDPPGNLTESRYASLGSDYPGPAGYPNESRYAALQPGYAGPESSPGESRYAAQESSPGESRYAALEPGYAVSEPGYPAVESGYASPEPSYPAGAPPRPPSVAPALESGYGHSEPGYSALDSGYVAPPSSVPPAAPVSRSGADPLASGRAAVGRSSATRGAGQSGYANPLAWRRGRPESETERAIGVLRRELGGPRVLAFANPKGGVHKTTATVLAAATIGSVRGRGVLAWDDNELRGTLGLRAGSARHARTIRHLVSDLVMIEASQGAELTARLDDFLRHASDGSYDVLAGEETPSFAARLDQHTVRRVLDLLRRTHEVICVDTGNNVESANWQTVLRAADQLVVTTVPREDAAFTADWMLDLLHEIGMGELADNAVTLLSCPTPGRSPLLSDLERHFATRTRAVAVVPYDPALETGSSIEYGQLQPETREAWSRAASVMIEPFVR